MPSARRTNLRQHGRWKPRKRNRNESGENRRKTKRKSERRNRNETAPIAKRGLSGNEGHGNETPRPAQTTNQTRSKTPPPKTGKRENGERGKRGHQKRRSETPPPKSGRPPRYLARTPEHASACHRRLNHRSTRRHVVRRRKRRAHIREVRRVQSMGEPRPKANAHAEYDHAPRNTRTHPDADANMHAVGLVGAPGTTEERHVEPDRGCLCEGDGMGVRMGRPACADGTGWDARTGRAACANRTRGPCCLGGGGWRTTRQEANRRK
ncbi:hypothetical protein B0H10DRAFT_14971 [Mycena sp. CBHHK59/15]|nr:hypothetical protein B0H10DRAFT_14971 [Mycena sp. CBHHK59/15]